MLIVVALPVGAFFFGNYYGQQNTTVSTTSVIAPIATNSQLKNEKISGTPHPGWKVLNLGDFSIDVPSDWAFYPDYSEYDKPPTYQKIYGSLKKGNLAIAVDLGSNFSHSASKGGPTALSKSDFYDVNNDFWQICESCGAAVAKTYFKPELLTLGTTKVIRQYFSFVPGQGNSYEGHVIEYNKLFYSYYIFLNSSRTIYFSLDVNKDSPTKISDLKSVEDILATISTVR